MRVPLYEKHAVRLPILRCRALKGAPRSVVRSAALALVLAPVVHANVLQHAVALPMTIEYDSNPRLDANNPAGLWLTRVAPAYTVSGRGAVDELQATLSLVVERSSDRSQRIDRQDPALMLRWTREAPRDRIMLEGRYDKTATRISELSEGITGDGNGTRTSKALLGLWRTALTERLNLSVDTDFRDQSYDRGAFIDHRTLNAGLTLSYELSERTEGFLRLASMRYEPRGSGDISRHHSALLGVAWAQSELTRWTVQGGASTVAGSDEKPGWLASVSGRFIGQRLEGEIEAGRFVTASALGAMRESDQVQGALRYAVSDRSHAGLDLSLRKNRDVRPNTVKQASLWFGRELSERWSVRVHTTHRRRESDDAGASAANIVGLTLTYVHPDF